MKYKPSVQDFCWGIGSIPFYLYFAPFLFWNDEDELSNIQATILFCWICVVTGSFFYINYIFGLIMLLFFLLGIVLVVKFSDNFNEALFFEWVFTKKPFQLKFEGDWMFKYKRNGILDRRWLEDNKRMKKWKQVDVDED